MKFILFCDSLKRTEGKSGIPYIGRIRNKVAWFLENCYIRGAKIPDEPLNNKARENKIIVSITSFPKRINIVSYSIKSLMLQTLKPDQIILWLAKEQFPNWEIPERLRLLQERGLEIRFCEDLKSYKKFYYAMKEQEDNILITYDDDLIYPPNSIEKLMEGHRKYPSCIICNRAQLFPLEENGAISSCIHWKVYSSLGVETPTHMIMASTGAGCLYPPHIFGDMVFDLDLIHKDAPTADDIWMKVMALFYDVKIVKTTKEQKPFSVIFHSQEQSLTKINDIEKKNDDIANKLQAVFSEAFLKLRKTDE